MIIDKKLKYNECNFFAESTEPLEDSLTQPPAKSLEDSPTEPPVQPLGDSPTEPPPQPQEHSTQTGTPVLVLIRSVSHD